MKRCLLMLLIVFFLTAKMSHAQETFLPKDAIRNVRCAQIYSGSGVVVPGPTAEKITSLPKEAMVAIYIGTKCGTCLAWSNDAIYDRHWVREDRPPEDVKFSDLELPDKREYLVYYFCATPK